MRLPREPFTSTRSLGRKASPSASITASSAAGSALWTASAADGTSRDTSPGVIATRWAMSAVATSGDTYDGQTASCSSP